MLAETYPVRVLLLTFCGFVNRHQADAIAYLVEENVVLKEQLMDRRLRLTDDQRRRLAAKASRCHSSKKRRNRWRNKRNTMFRA